MRLQLSVLFLCLTVQKVAVAYSLSATTKSMSIARVLGVKTTILFAEGSGKSRKRRIKGAIPSKTVDSSVSNVSIKEKKAEAPSKNIFAAADRIETVKADGGEFSFGEFTNRLSTLVARVDQKEKEKEQSLLPPLSGTVAERQAKYNEINPVLRFIEEQTAPTPAGEEPKSIKLAKTVAWAGVLALAFIELIVSVKTGGMPFELGKVNFGGGEQTFIVPKAPPVPTYDDTPFDSTLTGPRSL